MKHFSLEPTTSHKHIASTLTDIKETALSQDDLTLPVGDALGGVGGVPASALAIRTTDGGDERWH